MDVTSLSMVLDPSTNRKVINNSYRIIKKIGQGQYGKVLLGEVIRDPTTNNSAASSKIPARNTTVAIKTINRIDKSKLITKSYLSQTTKIKREIQIMKECNHPNVVNLYQVIDDLKFDKILLILEYCKFGEIDWKHYNHYYEKYQSHFDRKPLSINKILRDVVNGLEYLHKFKKIIHRDLKPSNLLIAEDNTIKISDFGVSLILQNNADDQKELSKIMGTPIFYAPELCQFVNNRLSLISKEDNNEVKKIKIDEKIDIWSLGVTLYCLIFNDLPFNGFNEFELFKNIVREELKFPKIKQTSRVTENDVKELKLLKDLIRKLLVKEPENRITLEEVKNHEFTTFDLSPGERRSFLNLNKNLFAAKIVTRGINNDCETPGAQNGDLSNKIKKFFGGASKKPAKDPEASSIASESTTESVVTNSAIDVKNLEPLDDLLDSYLDDSSSFASDIDDEDDVVVVDTTNMLDSLDSGASSPPVPAPAPAPAVEPVEQEAPAIQIKSKPKPLVLKQSTFDTKLQGLSKINTEQAFKPRSSFSSSRSQSIESPQSAGAFATTSSPKTGLYKRSPSRSTASIRTPSSPKSISSVKTPLTPTNNNIITIGASSPSASSFKAFFSPSRRFFSRNKNKSKTSEAPKTKPTISSLSSPEKKQKNPMEEKRKFTNLMEPPPIFGLNVAYPAPSGGASDSSMSSLKSPGGGAFPPSVTSSAKSSKRNSPTSINQHSRQGSRKNSFGSLTSGYGLSRITSSSSSLNLNAYLTDDNFSLASVGDDGGQDGRHNETLSDSDSEAEGANDTLILNDDSEIFRNFKSMNQYLDGLD